MPGKKPGPVNTYLFTDDPVTLIDTGVVQTADVLRQAMAVIGIEFRDIRRVIVTHGHIDHYGAAGIIKKESGAQIYASEADRISIESGNDVSARTFLRFLRLSSVPVKFWFSLWMLGVYFRIMARTCRVDVPLHEGDEVTLGKYRARVIETPGHSKGSVCLWLQNEKFIFSGDHILSHITPNAFVMLDDTLKIPVRKSQKEYYESLAKIERMNPAVVFPAHGESIYDLPGIANQYRKSFKQRQDLIIQIVRSGRNDVYSIARRLFPVIDRKNLILETFLMISEVFSHLQVLEEEHRVTLNILSGRIITSLAE